MFEQVHVLLPPNDASRGATAAAVAREFPSIHLDFHNDGLSGPHLRASDWEARQFDSWRFDGEVDAAETLHLIDDRGRGAPFPIEVLNRCQRAIGRRNRHSQSAAFDRVLLVHRQLHDVEKPLVLADYRHALDVWQWTLRLAPDAPMSLQLAALFHDVERLVSEATERIEQYAADYQSFKNAHAATGAAMTASTLGSAGISDAVIERTCSIVASHEQPSADEEIGTLNDADGLSFFSLNSNGYADYFGPERTRGKVAWTWNRMRAEARARLATVRLRDDVAAMLRELKETA